MRVFEPKKTCSALSQPAGGLCHHPEMLRRAGIHAKCLQKLILKFWLNKEIQPSCKIINNNCLTLNDPSWVVFEQL